MQNKNKKHEIRPKEGKNWPDPFLKNSPLCFSPLLFKSYDKGAFYTCYGRLLCFEHNLYSYTHGSHSKFYRFHQGTSRLGQRKVFCPVILIVLSEKKSFTIWNIIFFSIDKIDEDEKKPRLNEGDKKMKQSYLGFALVFV